MITDTSAVEAVPEFLTEAELAAELRIKPGTLQQWRYRGQGPRFVKLGRAVRYARTDVSAWLAANQMGGAA